MLQVLLALDGGCDGFMRLGMNQPVQRIALSEFGPEALTMLPDTARKVGGDADVKRTVWLIGQDIGPAALHATRVVPGGWPGQARP